jgi:hypothetical protein
LAAVGRWGASSLDATNERLAKAMPTRMRRKIGR